MRFADAVSWLLPLGLAAAMGCAAARSRGDHPSESRAEWDRRVAMSFTNGLLWKPREGPLEVPASKLAPLIIQELPDNAWANSNRATFFGMPGDGRLDLERPVIYAFESELVLKGRRHATVAYVWFRPPAHGESELKIGGFGIVLNSAGEPAIWTPLPEPEGRAGQSVFVADSLERAAAAQFGAPLPGRRYAIERGVLEAPEGLVARSLEDGPIPMGPMVYLAAPDSNITTILCRCMPAQVHHIIENRSYDLLPFELLDDSTRTRASQAVQQSTANLENSLRLPDEF